jgi:hypothetical protein
MTVTDASTREYLLMWLLRHGTNWANIHQLIDLDKAMGDEDEVHWNVALNNRYIYRSEAKVNDARGSEDRRKWKLTPKGVRFINKVHEVPLS